uniref:C4b-binding protein alpha chain-like n=1 Tax=Pelodiscus sinensis TaxID=13735 RepID=K7F723_PELSI|nr:complement receptor type 1-like isoform X1 [Pelodiscus sinensis]XP_025034322.1 complement receptor type 1-like isoform X1 [Pelodiscus sinensis]XP_025034323.1 complement receptor type 1-like isoform X1 [Pelodiscus sinensis]|eukprot:XP_025034321.1 complement receptor type 1-like isoform X1 [Pelodiscus sinensis]
MISLNPAIPLLLAAVFVVAVHSNCPEPPRFNFAELKEDYRNTNNFPVDSIVEYNCRSGYVKTYKSSLRCMANSQWTTTLEFCKARTCPHPGELENGRLIILTDLVFGATVNFTCEEGYRLIGTAQRKCVLEGSQVTWDKEIPYCQLIPCLPPPDIEHGTHTGTTMEEFNYGTSVTYQCDAEKRGQVPFSLIGKASIHCTTTDNVNGHWSGPAPQCKAVRCEQPKVNHGKQLIGYSPVYTYRSSVMFDCEHRYTLKGSSVVRCNENNSWDPPLPDCERSSCDDPPVIPNASQDHSHSTLFPAGTVVTYNCERGYELKPGISSASVTCLNDFTWSKHQNFCQRVRCPYPNIPNGKATLRYGSRKEAYEYEDRITVACNVGYALRNIETRYMCQDSREWGPPLPVCEPLCERPPSISEGRHDRGRNRVFFVGSRVTYSCNHGWSLVGASIIQCTAGDGGIPHWDKPTPECKEILCPIPHIENGTFEIQEFRFGHQFNQIKYNLGVSIIFKCNHGLSLKGSRKSICSDKGTWDPPFPVCSLERCSSPPKVDNADPEEKREFRVGTNVTYSCVTGYMLIPGVSPTVTCLQNLEWSKITKICQKVHCLNPVIRNGKQITARENETMYGDVVEFQCDFGYILKGSKLIECQANGTWHPQVPSCIQAECPKPEVQNGEVVNPLDEKKQYNVNESIAFKCSPGYQFSGLWYQMTTDSLNVTCSANGTWMVLPTYSANGTWMVLPECKKQSNQPVCKMARESVKFLQCGVPLTELITLLEVQKLYLEIKKLKQDLLKPQ